MSEAFPYVETNYIPNCLNCKFVNNPSYLFPCSECNGIRFGKGKSYFQEGSSADSLVSVPSSAENHPREPKKKRKSYNKSQRVKRVRDMLVSLQEEQEQDGGFNEFPQFCEDWLFQILDYVSEKGLKELAKSIEETSQLGITSRTRRSGNS